MTLLAMGDTTRQAATAQHGKVEIASCGEVETGLLQLGQISE
jgi:hypothetical protein